jgi:galactosamine-6-phosphate isomerase
MQLQIYNNYETLSEAAALQIAGVIRQNPTAVLCFASGHTPLRVCELLVQKIISEKTDISGVTFLGLDEWVGVPPHNEGSCHYFLYNTIFNPLGLQPHQIYMFDALSTDLEEQCHKMDAVIVSKGGIDCMLVGIGMNGHIGFNEPVIPFTNNCHVAALDETTVSVGQKYFSSSVSLSRGITIGLQHLMNTRQVILMANGEKKAAVIKKAIEEPVSVQLPASIMQTHANGIVMLDEAAASLLSKSSTHETE